MINRKFISLIVVLASVVLGIIGWDKVFSLSDQVVEIQNNLEESQVSLFVAQERAFFWEERYEEQRARTLLVIDTLGFMGKPIRLPDGTIVVYGAPVIEVNLTTGEVTTNQ